MAAGYGSAAVCLVALALLPTGVHAQPAPPAPHDDEAFDIMNLLAERGLHDIHNEWWNAYAQFTYISSFKLPFQAPYTNANGTPNSLSPDFEHSFTASLTLFAGVRLWRGAELYAVPEVIAERPLSQLRGLGGSIQNFELQKTGTELPQIYRARFFLRQTIDLGGERGEAPSDPLQLAGPRRARRLVFTLGNFSSLDVFDRNGVTGDPRQTFLNMAFMTHASWDFAADARGYSWGAAAEFLWDDWAVRVGTMAPPLDPNTLAVDPRIWEHFGDSLELEHRHVLRGQPGAVRLLGYLNREVIGRFDDAIDEFRAHPEHNAAACTAYNYHSTNATAPDLCWVRRTNLKLGIGLNVEQNITRDAALFLRAMYSDGQSEVDAFNSADRSLSVGTVVRGGLWRRRFDLLGAAFALGWISDSHARYLAMGGVDGFVGDGHLRHAPEGVAEIFYSLNLFKALWFSADYQVLFNPGFNADRGPVHVFAVRAHVES